MFCKRIIVWLSFFVICFSIIPVAHAEEYISKNANYWEHLMHWAIKGVDGIPLLSTAVQGTASFLEGDICSFSDDGYHYGERLVVIGESPDKSGYQMAKSVCKYCN